MEQLLAEAAGGDLLLQRRGWSRRAPGRRPRPASCRRRAHRSAPAAARASLPCVSSGMSATSSSSSVPPWASSKAPETRSDRRPTPVSVPNSSISSRSAGRRRAVDDDERPVGALASPCGSAAPTVSLPAPDGAGDQHAAAGRRDALDLRAHAGGIARRCRRSRPRRRRAGARSAFSRRSRSASTARSTTSSSRSALKGFSMKS